MQFIYKTNLSRGTLSHLNQRLYIMMPQGQSLDDDINNTNDVFMVKYYRKILNSLQ